MESEFKKAQLDTTLTLRQARDELVNLKYVLEQKKLEKEQSIYEAPSVLRNAEIEYERAQRNYEQQQQNYKTKEAQARTNMTIIGSDLSKAQNKLQALLGVLEELTIKAPIPGMVIYAKDWDGKKRIVGSTVSPWDPTVATLPDLSVMEVITFVNEVDIQKIKDGQLVAIGLDSDPNKKLEGKVKSVASIGEQKPNSDAKVFEVIIDVLTRDTTLKPAMTTSCNIICSSVKNALYVPLESIYQQNGLAYVYKKEGGRPVKQQVLVGVSNESSAVILGGLKKGENVYLNLPKDTTGLPLQKISSDTTATVNKTEQKVK
jgi:RND family efflux transporter MFP subunit